jgi:hypothetical protein
VESVDVVGEEPRQVAVGPPAFAQVLPKKFKATLGISGLRPDPIRVADFSW